MAYPPPVPPAARTNASPQVDNHPGDHNMISAALTEILNHIAALEQTLGPIGSITLWPSNTPPTNYLLCQGQSLLRTDYPEIFSLFGTAFNPAADATHFNLPDYRGRIPAGVNAAGLPLSSGIGEKFGSYDASLPTHQHPFGTGGATARHDHQMPAIQLIQSTAAPTFWTKIGGAPAGFDIASTLFDLNLLGTGVDRQDHAHTGTTNGAGVAPENMNIQPSLTVHFAMRVH